jgi:hypothetical protein
MTIMYLRLATFKRFQFLKDIDDGKRSEIRSSNASESPTSFKTSTKVGTFSIADSSRLIVVSMFGFTAITLQSYIQLRIMDNVPGTYTYQVTSQRSLTFESETSCTTCRINGANTRGLFYLSSLLILAMGRSFLSALLLEKTLMLRSQISATNIGVDACLMPFARLT